MPPEDPLRQYTDDLVERARLGKLDPVIGREEDMCMALPEIDPIGADPLRFVLVLVSVEHEHEHEQESESHALHAPSRARAGSARRAP